DIRHREIALSNYSGEAVIYDQPTEHIYSVTVNENLAHTDVKVIPTKIAVKTLSEILKEENLQSIDLIKIDVETHEAEVLEGFGEYIGVFSPVFLIEILTAKVAVKVNSILD